MRKLVIAVDCDDVLVPTAPWTIEKYNDVYGTDLHVAEFYSDDVSRWGTDSIGEAVARVGALIRSDEYATIAPFSDAIDAIRCLSGRHELHVVTGRPEYLEPITLVMLSTYFPDCFQTVEHTGLFEGKKKSKSEVCTALNADILVDDHIFHLRDVLNAGLNEVILFGDYPWNQADEGLDNVIRCADWSVVEKELERIAKR